jgi:tetratricopeptide (TPR) repeat protein
MTGLVQGLLRKIFGGPDEEQAAASAAAIIASEDLERIEEELKKLGHGYEAARLLNRAGDLYLVKGDRQAALKRYGDAIDAYLQSGEYDNAMAVCRKIIRVVPEVIRTRRTLAWLCLGKGFLEIAREHIEAYTKASIESGLEALAVQHLLLMGQYVERPDFRAFLGDKLAELGDEQAARRVREGAASESVRAAGWTPVVFAAMLTPDELRRAVERGVEIKAPTDEEEVDEFESLLFDPEQVAKRGRDSEPEDSGKERPPADAAGAAEDEKKKGEREKA